MSLEVSSSSNCNDEFTKIYHSRNEQLKNLSQLVDLASSSSGTGTGDGSGGGITVDDSRFLLRNLTSIEIQTLTTKCQCKHKDWSKVFLLVNNIASSNPQSSAALDQSLQLQDLLSETRFDGYIILDMIENTDDDAASLTGSNDIQRLLPPGVHSNLLVSNSIFKLKTCRVYKNTLINNTYVGDDTMIMNCGQISASPLHVKYGHLNIQVGPESGGGRNLILEAESTMIDVCNQLQQQPQQQSTSTNNDKDVVAGLNVFDKHCIVRDTPTIQNVYLHNASSIVAAGSIKNATLLPNASITNSSIVSDVVLQWNASIVDNSSVSETILMEQSQSGPNSFVASSVLGPDVHVSAGEIHASVIGPNTNAHHQSLVIGILWPLGRGNVGYGANVGSNHTGRIPDQETASGEGTFWGLSCVIKFPVDMTYSPYSIVAAGTTLPPQRICMPFSLILQGNNHKGKNDIIPGWVLQSSPYTLARSEKKFATRRKAKRHDYYTGWKIFRPETMEMCRWALYQLENTHDGPPTIGIGSNHLSDRARKAGVKAYRDCLQRYALHGLLSWILRNNNTAVSAEIEKKTSNVEIVNAIHYELLGREVVPLPSMFNPIENVEWPTFPWDNQKNTLERVNDEWEYQRSLLLEEFPVSNATNVQSWFENLFRSLTTLENDYARRIHKCKGRDDSRGSTTIPGYAQAHVSADIDPVVVDANRHANHVETTASKLLESLSTSFARCRL